MDQQLQPWISEHDIESGKEWRAEIESTLKDEQTKAGIFCITRENISSQWIHYEAGNLTGRGQRVIPYVFGFGSAGDVSGPLAGLQVAIANRSGSRKMICDLCKLHDGNETVVSRAFEKE